ncbi:hypothetical protein ACFQFC_18760 [Amorphoplanes digitatis]|uniref:Uncharacterized protein n=1 Tax=Actinoplanes digitatis TaxID=1868 RepID=A0A7W7I4F4_9ACTN|nr:hypothetical protein [Actinoplanes digitatis]MBB4766258.1 hypothetical protein [Actinoplanes digitatis]GID95969.1 hypothetical protein Adi01nite_53810 [Actinoplanes digitatis]
MNRLSTLPSAREQARRTLLLIGAPAAASLIVDVHGALFDGDLSTAALAALLRDEERDFAQDVPAAYRICPALLPDLAAARGLFTLSTWPVIGRIAAPATDELAAVVRIAEFIAMRETAGRAAAALLRRLAERVPGGPEAYAVQNPAALADAARTALAGVAVTPPPEETIRRWEELPERQQLFGVRGLPHQRGRR